MQPLVKIDKSNLDSVREKILEALKPLEKDLGVKFKVQKSVYFDTGDQGKFTLFACIGSDDISASPEAAMFRANYNLFQGWKGDELGKPCRVIWHEDGVEYDYVFTGFTKRRNKGLRAVIQYKDGSRFLYNPEVVLSGIAKHASEGPSGN